MKELVAYKCDFCRKLYQTKGFALRHEIRCVKNPENHRPCFSCANLIRKSVPIYSDTWEGGEVVRDVDALYCKAKCHFVFPPSIEHKGRHFEFGDFINDPMPKECELKKSYEE